MKPTWHTSLLRASVGTLALASLATTALADGPAIGIRFPFEYRSWTIKNSEGNEKQLTQIFAPAVVTLSLTSKTNIVLSTSGGSTEFGRQTETTTMSAVADLKAEIYHKFAHNHFIALAGVNVPSGKTDLTFDEFLAMEQANHPVLGMQMRQYGRGLDLNAGLGWSAPLGEQATLALAAGVVVPGAYTIQSGEAEFDPATRTSISGGLSLHNARWARQARSANLEATLHLFSKDVFGEKDAFEEGDQLDLRLRTQVETGDFNTSLEVAATFKQDDAVLAESGEPIAMLLSVPGTGTLIRGSLHYMGNTRWQPGMGFDWKHFDGADDTHRNGHAFGIGPSIGFGVGDANWLRLQGLYLTGKSGEGQDEFDLTGLSLSISYVWRVTQ